MRRCILVLLVALASCGGSEEPELTCEWVPAVNGIPGCTCTGRQPHSVAEDKAVCCAAPGAPAGLCGVDGGSP